MTIEDHAAEYPYLAEVLAEFTSSGGYDYDEEFGIALDLILDSVEQLKEQAPITKRGRRRG